MNRTEKTANLQRLSNTAVRFPQKRVEQHPSNPYSDRGFASHTRARAARCVHKVCSCKGLRVRFCIDFRKDVRNG